MAGIISAPENGSTPNSPSGGVRELYAKADGWYELNSSGVESKLLNATLSGYMRASDGRLTLTSGTPVTTSDVTGATMLYYTPYVGNQLALWDGTQWVNYTFTELSLSLSGWTASKNYDIWAYQSSGVATLDYTVWTNDTTRATALAYQNGTLVKSGDATRRYLGTIRTTASTGQCEDSLTKRYCWNYYNRLFRTMYCNEATPHTYANTVVRLWNNSLTNNQLGFVRGVNDTIVTGWFLNIAKISSATYCATFDIWIDSVATALQNGNGPSTYSTANETVTELKSGYPSEGYHYLSVAESTSSASGTGTFGWMNLYTNVIG